MKMEKRSSKLEVGKDSSGFIWLSPSPCPLVPCTSPTCPRVGALEYFLECECRLKKGMLQCPQLVQNCRILRKVRQDRCVPFLLFVDFKNS